MAEYIDKKYLDRKFQIDMMCLRCGTIFDNQKIIDSLPTADVVEREKIDDAIEEIRNCSWSEIIDNADVFMGKEKINLVRLDVVLEILGKLIESEE